MFKNIKEIIKTIFKKKEYIDYESNTSIFADIILESAEMTNGHIIFECANLLEEALKISKQRIILLNRSDNNNKEISELDFIVDLSEKEFNYFKSLVNRYSNLSSEKNVLMYQIEGFDSVLGHLVKIEKDAKEALPKLVDAEKSRAMFNRDIAYLEMELEELRDEKEMLGQGMELIKAFSLGIVVLATFLALILGFLNIFKGTNIFYPVVFISLILIFFIAFFAIVKSKIKSDIKLNIRKQNKAVTLLNKKNVVCLHHTKIIKFIHKKYMVKNSKHMAVCLSDLDKYKKLMDRVKVTKRVLVETENELELYLIKKNIKVNKLSLYDFVTTIDLDRKKDRLNRLLDDKKQFEKTLSDFYEMQSEVWLEIENIKKENENEVPLIEEMIKMFYREVDVYQQSVDKREDKN